MGPKKLPFQSTTTNTFDYKSMDQNDPNVKDYLGVDIGVDPGVRRRTALNQQASENRWNSAFMGGVPAHLRMQLQDAERREIGAQGAADEQGAEYQKNVLELARRERLLPQLIQTGGTQQGYQTSPGGGFMSGLGGLLGGAAGVAGLFRPRS